MTKDKFIRARREREAYRSTSTDDNEDRVDLDKSNAQVIEEQFLRTGAMEAETIVYFHPAWETVHKNAAAKRHWWQETKLRGEALPAGAAEGYFTLVDCPVPSFYYKKKAWPPELLSEAMETAVYGVQGMADAWLHPTIMTYVSEKYAPRWEPRLETMESLFSGLLAVYADRCLHERGEVTVLLGKPEETERQMELTRRLLLPYLPRINNLLFYYEEVEGVDIWEEEAPFLEDYSYEYGLVPRMLAYGAGETEKRYGGERCGGVILAYSKEAGMPGTKREERVVYVDMNADPAKERACAGKSERILYVSPSIYLDTIVKNSYDKKM